MNCVFKNCTGFHNPIQNQDLATIRCIQPLPHTPALLAVHVGLVGLSAGVTLWVLWSFLLWSTSPSCCCALSLCMQTVPSSAFQLRSVRRRHTQALDGPFLLQPGEVSIRSSQISSNLLIKDSGLGPATYDANRDATGPRAATPKVTAALPLCLTHHTVFEQQQQPVRQLVCGVPQKKAPNCSSAQPATRLWHTTSTCIAAAFGVFLLHCRLAQRGVWRQQCVLVRCASASAGAWLLDWTGGSSAPWSSCSSICRTQRPGGAAHHQPLPAATQHAKLLQNSSKMKQQSRRLVM